MLAKDKILRETSPLSIFLVKSGSGGNRLLFRYPYDASFQFDPDLNLFNEQPVIAQEQDRLQFQSVIDENDKALCNMFSVHPNLCGQKFEIKINSVRHVGHPMSLATVSPSTGGKRAMDMHRDFTNDDRNTNLDLPPYDSLTVSANRSQRNKYKGDITSFNIVCALRSSASFDIVDCYHDISKRLAIALSFEERRCSYLSKEIKTMLTTLEESDMIRLSDHEEQVGSSNQMQKLFDNDQTNRKIEEEQSSGMIGTLGVVESVYSVILRRSNLARDLKRIFVDLSTNGIVDLKINNWVSVSFCLPQRVHRLKLMTHNSMPAIGTKDIKKCLTFLRPYHGLLLLHEPQELLDSLPIDASPAFIQLIRVIKPDKNLMELSVDANLTLMQVFNIVAQLIYWAKATVIYPICDSNIYAIHPLASIGVSSALAASFKSQFPSSKSLHHYLADFSDGTSLSQLNGPLLSVEEKMTLYGIVTWLLQRRILTQIHKYTFLVVDRDLSTTVDTKSGLTLTSLNSTINSSIDQTDSSPQDIGASNRSSNGQANSLSTNNNVSIVENQSQQLSQHLSHRTNHQSASRSGDSFGSMVKDNHLSSRATMNKNSMSSEISLESYMMGRLRVDSFPDSQEEVNFGPNSLSSTPNSNLEFPSPSNNDAHIIRGSSLSSSCPLEDPLHGICGDSILAALQQAGITQAGIKSIFSVPSAKNFDDLRLLIRLIPYFDGTHHVEDIMFFENLERSQVLILCDKFREVLCNCHYEDVAVNQLSPFSSS